MSDKINPRTGEPYKLPAKQRKKMQWSPERKRKFQQTMAERFGKNIMPDDPEKARLLKNKLAREARARLVAARRAERAAQTNAHLAAKAKATAANPFPGVPLPAPLAAVLQSGEAQGGEPTEFPLDAIPSRERPAPLRKYKKRDVQGAQFVNGHGNTLPAGVYAEYDIERDQMVLVMGKLRLPFVVKV